MSVVGSETVSLSGNTGYRLWTPALGHVGQLLRRLD
jgi:hypothetical protein